MRTHNPKPEPQYDAPADWDAVFADPPVTEVTHYAPPNNADMHGDDDDDRILENARRQADWLGGIFADVMAEQ